ncbi:cation:proton antiporter [Paracraurococcus lichenis]|uniref:Sodium:proton antiporter n=1 Tax=Paracraurococcus lichenis TaxID=3064888 RepID=A0ABT9E1J2_9PROT|nr:sodium:proton antiporter [Paracraurococcus sp. LOR1-02]MDO9710036.1 sodium:proton antiporter [Paracraurococcus sp. LOR1-02]
MLVFEITIALLLAGALLALWARRLRAPYPALLALAGTLGAVVPGLPEVTLDPELALALFVAPTLLDAAYDASPRDLRDNWLPVTGLVVVCVLCTTAAVAAVARWVEPGIPWAAALALGAIVAPPDASAAAAVLRQLRPPHRVLVILEGESLLNDATALLIYRVAVGAAVTGVFDGWSVLPMLLLTCGGGAALGHVWARLYFWLTERVEEIAVSVLLQFLGVFALWMLAERLGVSPIIAMVAHAITIARHAPMRSGARHRIASYAVWEVAVFVLNILAFILIGLQLRGILQRLDGGAWRDVLFAAVACATVILVRVFWVMGYNTVIRWKIRRWGMRTRRPMQRPNWQGGVIISWCGMRGIVTLAAALALPEDFPFRDLILLTAFAVTLVTLVAQGLTLRWLMERLSLPDDGAVEREVELARAETARAALGVLKDAPDGAATARLREEYKARLQPAEGSAAALAALQSQAVAAQRARLGALRRDGAIGDDAFHVVEEEIDLLELSGDPRIRALRAP